MCLVCFTPTKETAMHSERKIQRVVIGFINREEVRTPVKESGWTKFWREVHKEPAPVTITYKETPMPIEVSAVLEDEKETWMLWMTREESEPLRVAGVQLSAIMLPLERGIILRVPKTLLTIVDDEAAPAKMQACGTGSN